MDNIYLGWREIDNDKEAVFDTSLLTEKLQRVTGYLPIPWAKTLERF